MSTFDKKKKAFVSGKFPTGAHATEHAKTNATAQFMRVSTSIPMKTVFPTVMTEPNADWNSSIRSDITALMGCDELHLLHNWQGHKRSEILRNIAMAIGIKTVYH